MCVGTEHIPSCCVPPGTPRPSEVGASCSAAVARVRRRTRGRRAPWHHASRCGNCREPWTLQMVQMVLMGTPGRTQGTWSGFGWSLKSSIANLRKGRFPKISGAPKAFWCINWMFHIINQPFRGTSILGNLHVSIYPSMFGGRYIVLQTWHDIPSKSDTSTSRDYSTWRPQPTDEVSAVLALLLSIWVEPLRQWE